MLDKPVSAWDRSARVHRRYHGHPRARECPRYRFHHPGHVVTPRTPDSRRVRARTQQEANAAGVGHRSGRYLGKPARGYDHHAVEGCRTRNLGFIFCIAAVVICQSYPSDILVLSPVRNYPWIASHVCSCFLNGPTPLVPAVPRCDLSLSRRLSLRCNKIHR